MKVAAQLQPFLADVNEAIRQAQIQAIELTPELARANLNKLSALVTKVPTIARITDSFVEGLPQDAVQGIALNKHLVPVRIYQPNFAPDLPIILYFHGGGHLCGSVELYDPLCRKIALTSNAIVISVEYRLAPEHPYPAGINDAQLVLENYRQVLSQIQSSGRLFIAGDSAGGAICTTLAMNNQDNPEITIHGQMLIYPSVDYTMTANSITEYGQGYLLERKRIAWYFDHYFAHDEDRRLASALYGPITANLPPTLVITAGCDPLKDEAAAYVDALKQQAVPVQHQQFDDMIHAFMNIEDLVPEACARVLSLMSDFVKHY